MKNRIMLISFFSFSMICFCQSAEPNLVIKTNSDQSLIFINDQYYGEGNISVNLPIGFHKIIVKENKNVWGNGSITDSIKIQEGINISRNYEFRDGIFVSTIPEDVKVKSDNKVIGHTPLVVSRELKKLELSRKDYETKFLNLDSSSVKIQETLNFTGQVKEESFRNTIWFDLLIGSAIILGGTAAYYKIQADKSYDSYLKNDSAEYLDKTDRYDTYSGIAFGALQVNFGFILYYLLVD